MALDSGNGEEVVANGSFNCLSFDDEEGERVIDNRESNSFESTFALLREKYALDSIVGDLNTDSAKALKLSDWTHRLWKHNGLNEPTATDPVSIIEEAKQVGGFRCVEYSIVLSAALNSIGTKARVLRLMTEDVETREAGAGHVVVEYYNREFNKWVFTDPQVNVTPSADDIPLNAVEFQSAICCNRRKINNWSRKRHCQIKMRRYKDWVFPYLFYFRVNFASSSWNGDPENTICLVPAGHKKPNVFQRKYSLDGMSETHSWKTFYPEQRELYLCNGHK